MKKLVSIFLGVLFINLTYEASAGEMLLNITEGISINDAKQRISLLQDANMECHGGDKYLNCLITRKSNKDKQLGYLVACHEKVNSIMQVISTEADFLDYLELYLKSYGSPKVSMESGGGPSTPLPKYREIVYMWKTDKETIKLKQRPLEYNHDGSTSLERSLTAWVVNEDLWKKTCWK